MEIIRGKTNYATKCTIFGVEGIGKSTIASKFPNPVFIDTEGSTKFMDVARTQRPSSWTMLMEQVKYFRDNPKEAGTIVIDTADWAEQLCINEILAKNNKNSIEAFSYGKGYTMLQEEFGKLLNTLEEVVERGVNVVLTAHAKMRKFEQPDEMGAYDRWELKLTKQVAPIVKEWSDMVLFCNYKTYVVKDENGKAKAQGGSRVMYTTHHPCWDAKNRHGLPDEIPMDYEAIKEAIESNAPTAPVAVEEPVVPPAPVAEEVKPEPAQEANSGIPGKLVDLMRNSGILEDQLRKVFADKGYYPIDTPWDVMEKSGFVDGWIVPNWGKIVETIYPEEDNLPFTM